MGRVPSVRSPVGPVALRRVLGEVPSPVTVLTAATPAGPVGLTVGSFVSVSLEPPLVGVFVDEGSTSWPAVREAGSFAVNVLAHDQQELCARFARSGGPKFAGLEWHGSPQGNPLFPGTSAWLDCAVEEIRKLGDHDFAVARVTDLGSGTDIAPLVFHRRVLHPFTRRTA